MKKYFRGFWRILEVKVMVYVSFWWKAIVIFNSRVEEGSNWEVVSDLREYGDGCRFGRYVVVFVGEVLVELMYGIFGYVVVNYFWETGRK